MADAVCVMTASTSARPITRRALAVSSLLLLGTRDVCAQGSFQFKIGCDTPLDHPVSQRLAEAGRRVAERSSGQLSLQVFPNSQLGGDSDMLSQVRSGGLELFAAPSLTLSTLVPLSNLTSVGYAFASYDQVWHAMDGKLGGAVRGAIAKSGLVPIGQVWDNGFRQITNSVRPITGPADLKGLKLRIPATALLTSCFQALGASPTSISFNEVYSALQTHVIDGQENPLSLIETAKLYEVQKFCSLSRHCWSGFWIVGNRRAMASLPDSVRAALEDAMTEGAVAERADIAEQEGRMSAALADSGMTINTPDRKLFQNLLREAGFYRRWQQTFGEANWQALAEYSPELG